MKTFKYNINSSAYIWKGNSVIILCFFFSFKRKYCADNGIFPPIIPIYLENNCHWFHAAFITWAEFDGFFFLQQIDTTVEFSWIFLLVALWLTAWQRPQCSRSLQYHSLCISLSHARQLSVGLHHKKKEHLFAYSIS